MKSLYSALTRRSLAQHGVERFRVYAAEGLPTEQSEASASTKQEDAPTVDGTPPLLQTPTLPLALPWTPLLALLAVHVSNQWSRALIYYVNNFSDVDATGEAAADAAFRYANVDLGYGPNEYALLASLGFTVVFAAASFVAGRLADTQDRRMLSVGACVAWSAATAAMANADSFESLLVVRSLMGLAMAVSAPAAYSLIAEISPPDRLASASSVYAVGIYFGGALASLAGVALDETLGWRGTSYAVGATGLIAAAICWFTVTDPRTASSAAVGSFPGPPSDGERAVDKGEELSTLASIGRVMRPLPVRLLFAAAALRFCAGFGLGVWKAPFFLAKFPAATTTFAVSNAGIIAVGGGLSAVLGGRLADALASTSPHPTAARMQVPLWGSLLAAPLLAMSLGADTIEVSDERCPSVPTPSR